MATVDTNDTLQQSQQSCLQGTAATHSMSVILPSLSSGSFSACIRSCRRLRKAALHCRSSIGVLKHLRKLQKDVLQMWLAFNPRIINILACNDGNDWTNQNVACNPNVSLAIAAGCFHRLHFPEASTASLCTSSSTATRDIGLTLLQPAQTWFEKAVNVTATMLQDCVGWCFSPHTLTGLLSDIASLLQHVHHDRQQLSQLEARCSRINGDRNSASRTSSLMLAYRSNTENHNAYNETMCHDALSKRMFFQTFTNVISQLASGLDHLSHLSAGASAFQKDYKHVQSIVQTFVNFVLLCAERQCHSSSRNACLASADNRNTGNPLQLSAEKIAQLQAFCCIPKGVSETDLSSAITKSVEILLTDIHQLLTSTSIDGSSLNSEISERNSAIDQQHHMPILTVHENLCHSPEQSVDNKDQMPCLMSEIISHDDRDRFVKSSTTGRNLSKTNDVHECMRVRKRKRLDSRMAEHGLTKRKCVDKSRSHIANVSTVHGYQKAITSIRAKTMTVTCDVVDGPHHCIDKHVRRKEHCANNPMRNCRLQKHGMDSNSDCQSCTVNNKSTCKNHSTLKDLIGVVNKEEQSKRRSHCKDPRVDAISKVNCRLDNKDNLKQQKNTDSCHESTIYKKQIEQFGKCSLNQQKEVKLSNVHKVLSTSKVACSGRPAIVTRPCYVLLSDCCAHKKICQNRAKALSNHSTALNSATSLLTAHSRSCCQNSTGGLPSATHNSGIHSGDKMVNPSGTKQTEVETKKCLSAEEHHCDLEVFPVEFSTSMQPSRDMKRLKNQLVIAMESWSSDKLETTSIANGSLAERVKRRDRNMCHNGKITSPSDLCTQSLGHSKESISHVNCAQADSCTSSKESPQALVQEQHMDSDKICIEDPNHGISCKDDKKCKSFHSVKERNSDDGAPSNGMNDTNRAKTAPRELYNCRKLSRCRKTVPLLSTTTTHVPPDHCNRKAMIDEIACNDTLVAAKQQTCDNHTVLSKVAVVKLDRIPESAIKRLHAVADMRTLGHPEQTTAPSVSISELPAMQTDADVLHATKQSSVIAVDDMPNNVVDHHCHRLQRKNAFRKKFNETDIEVSEHRHDENDVFTCNAAKTNLFPNAPAGCCVIAHSQTALSYAKAHTNSDVKVVQCVETNHIDEQTDSSRTVMNAKIVNETQLATNVTEPLNSDDAAAAVNHSSQSQRKHKTTSNLPAVNSKPCSERGHQEISHDTQTSCSKNATNLLLVKPKKCSLYVNEDTNSSISSLEGSWPCINLTVSNDRNKPTNELIARRSEETKQEKELGDTKTCKDACDPVEGSIEQVCNNHNQSDISNKKEENMQTEKPTETVMDVQDNMCEFNTIIQPPVPSSVSTDTVYSCNYSSQINLQPCFVFVKQLPQAEVEQYLTIDFNQNCVKRKRSFKGTNSVKRTSMRLKNLLPLAIQRDVAKVSEVLNEKIKQGCRPSSGFVESGHNPEKYSTSCEHTLKQNMKQETVETLSKVEHIEVTHVKKQIEDTDIVKDADVLEENDEKYHGQIQRKTQGRQKRGHKQYAKQLNSGCRRRTSRRSARHSDASQANKEGDTFSEQQLQKGTYNGNVIQMDRDNHDEKCKQSCSEGDTYIELNDAVDVGDSQQVHDVTKLQSNSHDTLFTSNDDNISGVNRYHHVDKDCETDAMQSKQVEVMQNGNSTSFQGITKNERTFTNIEQSGNIEGLQTEAEKMECEHAKTVCEHKENRRSEKDLCQQNNLHSEQNNNTDINEGRGDVSESDGISVPVINTDVTSSKRNTDVGNCDDEMREQSSHMDMEAVPVKRKRGRPRHNITPATRQSSRARNNVCSYAEIDDPLDDTLMERPVPTKRKYIHDIDDAHIAQGGVADMVSPYKRKHCHVQSNAICNNNVTDQLVTAESSGMFQSHMVNTEYTDQINGHRCRSADRNDIPKTVSKDGCLSSVIDDQKCTTPEPQNTNDNQIECQNVRNDLTSHTEEGFSEEMHNAERCDGVMNNHLGEESQNTTDQTGSCCTDSDTATSVCSSRSDENDNTSSSKNYSSDNLTLDETELEVNSCVKKFDVSSEEIDASQSLRLNLVKDSRGLWKNITKDDGAKPHAIRRADSDGAVYKKRRNSLLYQILQKQFVSSAADTSRYAESRYDETRSFTKPAAVVKAKSDAYNNPPAYQVVACLSNRMKIQRVSQPTEVAVSEKHQQAQLVEPCSGRLVGNCYSFCADVLPEDRAGDDSGNVEWLDEARLVGINDSASSTASVPSVPQQQPQSRIATATPPNLVHDQTNRGSTDTNVHLARGCATKTTKHRSTQLTRSQSATPPDNVRHWPSPCKSDVVLGGPPPDATDDWGCLSENQSTQATMGSWIAAAMGLYSCICGATFPDNWSYLQHEAFCSGQSFP